MLWVETSKVVHPLNSRQLQYAIALAKIRNFSQVAEMFHITQPALSKQILNLEHELGVKLFDRKTIPLTLTVAGDYFFQEAQQILYREDHLLRSMEQYRSGEKGRVRIGISPFRNLTLIPCIIQKAKKKYPGIQIFLYEAKSDILRKEAAEGKFDFAILNLPVDESVLNVIPLEQETLVLAVPRYMSEGLPFTGDPKHPVINFGNCKDLPFVVVSHPQEMRRYFDRLCAEAGFIPNIAVEVDGGVTAAWSMARANLGATLLPLQFVSYQNFDENLTLFSLNNDLYIRQPVIVTKQGQYLSECAQYIISLLTER